MFAFKEPKKIAVTLGDPAGIGPEIVLKAVLSDEVSSICRPVIVGSRRLFSEAEEMAGKRAPDGLCDFVEAGELPASGFERCRSSAVCGAASAACIERAVELARNREVDAVVTAPITKASLKMAGLHWPGHTEMLAALTGTSDYAMMLVGGPLRVVLATIHTSLKSVPGLIKSAAVLRIIRLADRASKMLGIRNPKIGVAGLNPHAGEGGMFGDEETREIEPAVREAVSLGIPVSGPYPPDTLFHRAYNGEFDIIVCMYHDQGLIPLKMIAFDKGVNVTVGLPIIRTSPDHGTAYDRAWRNTADPSSMIEAIKLATTLSIRQ